MYNCDLPSYVIRCYMLGPYVMILEFFQQVDTEITQFLKAPGTHVIDSTQHSQKFTVMQGFSYTFGSPPV
jgi:hypothetical protein